MGIKVRKYKGQWYVFINHNGHRKAKRIGSREAAERVRREIEARLANGDPRVFQEQKTPLFKEYAQHWLSVHVNPHCKKSTAMRYEQVLRLNLLPRFGAAPLDRITREALKTYFAELLGSGKLAHGSLKNILATIRAILNYAVEEEIISINPAVRLGRIALRAARRKPPEFLTADEAQRFLRTAKVLRPERYLFFLTALRSGLRLGELLALRWQDIQFGESDLDHNRFILVRQNYTRREFTTTKNRKERRVDLSKELRQALLDLRDQRTIEAIERGQFTDPCQPAIPQLVFPSRTGGPLDGNNVYNRDFVPCIEGAGIRRVSFHALRHTFASLLLQQGASLAYVKEQLGHSSIQVTVDIYGHLIPGGNIDWIDRLDTVTSRPKSATPAQPAPTSKTVNPPQLIENIGGPSRIRTCDQRIMSPPL